MDPAVAFRVEPQRPGLVVRVNFGLLTGRDVTYAEIDDLARELRRFAPLFEIVAEDRHEFSEDAEASVHQVVIEMPSDDGAVEIVAIAERWARACFDARHSDLTEL
ncbi:MAG: hypothetical protein JOY72_01420 [Actinobacteria bacterium]|nr:hypothetical protein [Actinomycetota bacterium]MBV8597349.1 hypothetical protein [Actinomycetota bacterium]